MRVFLAVHPGTQLVQTLTTALDSASPRLPVRWTRSATWHVTLQFLGEWPAERVEQLQDALAARSWGSGFDLIPAGLGAFPRLRAPRVLFLQFEDDGQATLLADRVRATVARVWPDGPQDTKSFRSHLTLSRIRSPLGRDELDLLQDLDLQGLPRVEVQGFSLMQSRLQPTGAIHEGLGFYPLD